MNACALTSAALFSLIATSAMGATLAVSGTADNGSRFIEHSQGAFWELGQTRASTRVTDPDGAFSISSLPSYVAVGGGGTAFPNKQNFLNLGTLAYDDETGIITGLEFNFADHVAPGAFSYYQGVIRVSIGVATSYTTSFNTFAGTVTTNGTSLPFINFTSEIVFSIDGSAVGDPVLTYTGSFAVADNEFVLAVNDSNISPLFREYNQGSPPGHVDLEWAITGTISDVVPVPSAGDFDLDGDVDGHDFLLWQREPNIGSLADWKANFGHASLSGSSAAVVPEPTTILLIAAAIFAAGSRRHLRW